MNESDAFSMGFDESKSLGFNRDDAGPLLEPPLLRVYAAGSLTNNNDETRRDCVAVRAILKRILGTYDFHGVGFEVYDPGDVTQPGSNHTEEEVYELNYEQCVLADLVVFHVNVPSLGVGCEAQISADATVPRVTLAKRDVPVSRMFAGIFSTTITSIQYENYADLELQLFRQIPLIAAATVRSAQRRRPVLSAFSDLQIGRIIFKQRIVHNVTIDQLARHSDIKESWLRRLERNHVLAACCTAMQLNRIASATHCYVKTVDAQNLTTLVPRSDVLSADERESLDNLASYICAKSEWLPDDRVFRLWNSFQFERVREAAEAVEYREGDHKVISIDEWRRRDQTPRLF